MIIKKRIRDSQTGEAKFSYTTDNESTKVVMQNGKPVEVKMSKEEKANRNHGKNTNGKGAVGSSMAQRGISKVNASAAAKHRESLKEKHGNFSLNTPKAKKEINVEQEEKVDTKTIQNEAKKAKSKVDKFLDLGSKVYNVKRRYTGDILQRIDGRINKIKEADGEDEKKAEEPAEDAPEKDEKVEIAEPAEDGKSDETLDAEKADQPEPELKPEGDAPEGGDEEKGGLGDLLDDPELKGDSKGDEPADEPVADEPAADEPKDEEPKDEEPKDGEEATDEPVAGEKKDEYPNEVAQIVKRDEFNINANNVYDFYDFVINKVFGANAKKALNLEYNNIPTDQRKITPAKQIYDRVIKRLNILDKAEQKRLEAEVEGGDAEGGGEDKSGGLLP